MKIKETKFIKTSEITPDELQKYIIQEVGEKSESNIYNYLKDLNYSYPNFKNWFYNRVVVDLENKNRQREIILAFTEIEVTEGESKHVISGLAILKKTHDERKICTFRIHEEFRSKGIGKSLFEECFEYLETNLPIITISEDRREMFNPLIEQFNFQLTEVLPDYYREGTTEYVYNGKLT